MKSLPAAAHVEPRREVLRRMWLHGVSLSIRADEPNILAAAELLAQEGWLTNTGSYPHFGTTYTQFKPTEKLDLKALKDI